MIMVKFKGLDCKYSESGEPIVNTNGLVMAKFSFKATIPKGYMDYDNNTYYKPVDVVVLMLTEVDLKTPFNDWLISANGFASIWINAANRHDRHVYEAAMAKVGIIFNVTGDKWEKSPATLKEMHNKED